MRYVTHPLIRPDALEARSYQMSVALRALDGNTMVVLPTGLGKTAVALIVLASRVKHAGGKVLMMAPTKPLIEQHFRFFQRLFIDPGGGPGAGCTMYTGETKPEARAEAFLGARLIFATPQVIDNDCQAGRYDLKDVSLLIVDECHRAVGDYAYVPLAGLYMQQATSPLILGMTASPGGKEEKVLEVCENLHISTVESRTEEDPDVRPYIHERQVRYEEVELPLELMSAVASLRGIMQNRLDSLDRRGFAAPPAARLTQRSLNKLNGEIQTRIRAQDRTGYLAASLLAEVMKLRHAVSLAETQGSRALTGYLSKLSAEGSTGSGSKASQRLAKDDVFRGLLMRAESWPDEIHPKPDRTIEIVQAQLREHPESRVIVFATFRDTVRLMTDRFKARGIDARAFVGQAKKGKEKGLSQKEQIETLQQFREGEFQVLISTSVGEEGLDVPSTDMVVFYEAVPSEVRSIQRKGRTGRHSDGKIVVLITKGTSDEACRRASKTREKAMGAVIKEISSHPAGERKEEKRAVGQLTLF